MFDQFPNANMYDPSPRYLDAGAGRNGVWGLALRQVLNERGLPGAISGVEIETVEPPPVVYSDWRQADFISEDVLLWGNVFCAAVSNPPFYPSHYFVMRMHTYCLHGGTIMALLPVNFLNGQWRHQVFYKEYMPCDVYPINQRVSYSGDGKTDAREYMLAFFRKGYTPPFARMWTGWNWRPEVKAPTPRRTKTRRTKQAEPTATQEELFDVNED